MAVDTYLMRQATSAPLDELQEYLDSAIRNWRDIRDRAVATGDYDEKTMAIHYIDAFQSVRVSIIGELLPHEGGVVQNPEQFTVGGNSASTVRIGDE